MAKRYMRLQECQVALAGWASDLEMLDVCRQPLSVGSHRTATLCRFKLNVDGTLEGCCCCCAAAAVRFVAGTNAWARKRRDYEVSVAR